MPLWTSDDIPWQNFDPAALDPETLKLVKAAAMVERNATDYTEYLKQVFRNEPDFLAIADSWREEEVQHGIVLGRYAEMADPDFDFKTRFKRFTDGYRIPLDLADSVRGSLIGELLARCIVETGTSSLYSALRDSTDEPVLRDICHRIAGDEFRHYKMFYTLMRALQTRQSLSLLRRILVAIARIREADDDELAFAWHAANESLDTPYDRTRCAHDYALRAFGNYQDQHAERAANMILKAIGLDPQGWAGMPARSFTKWKLTALARAA
jgi:hypothetical protein